MRSGRFKLSSIDLFSPLYVLEETVLDFTRSDYKYQYSYSSWQYTVLNTYLIELFNNMKENDSFFSTQSFMTCCFHDNHQLNKPLGKNYNITTSLINWRHYVSRSCRRHVERVYALHDACIWLLFQSFCWEGWNQDGLRFPFFRRGIVDTSSFPVNMREHVLLLSNWHWHYGIN